MRIARLLLPLLILPLFVASAQETEPPDGTRITTALVSGFEVSRLSAPLKEEIDKLPGTPLNRQQLRDLAARIEIEHPRYIAGVRISADPDGGARVVFVVARMPDEQREANVNNRYVVESVEIRGVPEHQLDPALVSELYGLAGRQLDSDEAERLETRMREALRSTHTVRRRSIRGTQPGNLRLVFIATRAEWARWLRFEPASANTLFHSDQGWQANCPLSIGGRDFHVTPILALDINDELIEEFTGFALRFESLKLGTERLGLFFEWFTFDQQWQPETLAALTFDPRIPPPYRNRMGVTPLLKFAITPKLTIGGGVSIVELDALPDDLPVAQMANAAIGAISFTQRTPPDTDRPYSIDASLGVRAGTSSLESDLVYERYLGQVEYWTRWSHHEVLVSGMAGWIDGEAPLFERFSLGDSRTLRGWNKYDIAPAGGDRMFHTSVEYQYRGFGVFLDTGAVWNGAAEKRVRVATGVNFTPGPVFFTLGFPLNTDEFRAVFTMGFRFPHAGARVTKH
jgi:hypothetical protein